MLFFTLTFLIVGAMVAGYSMRIARLEGRYMITEAEMQNEIALLVEDLNRIRGWAKSLERDAIKNQVYEHRTTRAFSGD